MRCPACNQPLTSNTACNACGLPLTGPTAGRLWQIDQELGRLQTERLNVLQTLRSEQRNSSVPAAAGAPMAPGALSPTRADSVAGPAAADRPAWTGQQILLGIGAALLSFGAIVFAAVNWQNLGLLGQGLALLLTILALYTGANSAQKRGLGASAEALTVAAGGVHLALLYATEELYPSNNSWLLTSSILTTLLAAAAWRYNPRIRTSGIGTHLAAASIIPILLTTTNTPGEAWTVILASTSTLLLIAALQSGHVVREVGATIHGTILLLAGALGAAQGYGALEQLAPTSEKLLGAAAVAALGAGVLGAARLYQKRTDATITLVLTAASTTVLAIAAHILVLAAENNLDALVALTGTSAAVLLGAAAYRKHIPALTGTSTLAALLLTGSSSTEAALILLTTGAGLALATTNGGKSWAPWYAGTAVTAVTAGAVLTAEAAGATDSVLLLTATTVAAGAAALALRTPKETATALRGTATTIGILAWIGATKTDLDTATAITLTAAAVLGLYTITKRRTGMVAAVAALLYTSLGTILLEHATTIQSTWILTTAAAGSLLLARWKELEPEKVAHETLTAILAAAALITAVAADDLVTGSVSLTLAILAAIAAAEKHRENLGYVAATLAAYGNSLLVNGTETLEVYTIPFALALLAAGTHISRRRHERGEKVSSWQTYGPALSVALVPSTVLALGNGGPRTALALLAATILMIVGSQMRKQAVLIVPAVCAAALGLELLGPVLATVPRWSVLVLTGAALLAVGVSYEARLRDLRRAGEWVKSLT